MNKSKQSSRSRVNSKHFVSDVGVLRDRMKANQAWKGNISIQEGSLILKGHIPFTYMFGQGFDENHFIMFYVGADCEVHLKNVRIRYVNGVPIFRNGAGDTYAFLEDLVPGCLKCSATVCNPLST